jgi:hypothetical protein
MRRSLLAVIAAICATGASAQPKLSAIIGVRDETNSSESWPAIGVGADFGGYRWRVRPEVGLAMALDPFNDGHETEVFAGALTHWHRVRTRLHVGAGVSSLSSDWGPFEGSSSGVYVRGGALLPVKRHWLGVDARYVDAHDLDASGTTFPVGYFQISLHFAW